MAIDPVTGEEIPASALSTVTIPDVGSGDFVDSIKTSVGNAQSEASALTGAANASLPGYTAPDESQTTGLVQAGSTYMRPEDTVSYQMDQLLNKDSDYMKVAESRADEKAQKYGLLGSSMSVGAAHRAAIESALPIAQQDAQTSSKFGLQEQATKNQIGAIGAETAYSSALMGQRMAGENVQNSLKAQFELTGKGIDAESQVMLRDLEGRWQFVAGDAQMRLEAALKEQLNTQQIDAEIAVSARKSASELIQNYQVGVEELLKDPDFLQLGATTIRNTINNMLKTATASIQFVADSTGVNLDQYLDDFETNATFTASVGT